MAPLSFWFGPCPTWTYWWGEVYEWLLQATTKGHQDVKAFLYQGFENIHIHVYIYSSLVHGEEEAHGPVNMVEFFHCFLALYNMIWFYSNINQWLTSSAQVDDKAPV